jgi:hypothetical protein
MFSRRTSSFWSRILGLAQKHFSVGRLGRFHPFKRRYDDSSDEFEPSIALNPDRTPLAAPRDSGPRRPASDARG